MLKKTSIILSLLIVITIITACTTTTQSTMHTPMFASYQDIPGVTQDHINAITQVLNQRDYFTFAMSLSDEMLLDTQGNYQGFAVHFTHWLYSLFGVPFIPQSMEFTPLIHAVQAHEVDFTGQLSKTPERAEIFHMTSPITLRSLAKVQPPSTPSLQEISQERPPRIVFFTDTITSQILADSQRFNAFEALYACDLATIAHMLATQEADAFISHGHEILQVQFPGYQVARIYPYIFGTAAFSTGNPELAPFIEVIQLALDNGGMRLLQEMYSQGMVDFRRHQLSLLLTPEEEAFIQNAPTILIAAQSYGYPVSFYNNFEGAFQGASHDVLDKVAKLTGLNFQVVNPQSMLLNDLFEMLVAGEVSLLAGAVRPEELMLINGENILWSDPFITDQYVLISQTSHPNITPNEVLYMRVGMPANRAHQARFQELFPGHVQTFYYHDMDSLIEAIQVDEICMIFSSVGGLLHLTNYLELTGFRANLLFDETYDIYFAGNDPVLLSIINHTLAVIDEQAIESYWRSRTFDHSMHLLSMRTRMIITIITSVLIVLAALLILLLVLYKYSHSQKSRLAKLVSEKTKELETEQLVLRTTLDSIPDLLFCKDTHYNLTRVNTQYEKFFGVNREELLGKLEKDTLPQISSTSEDWYELDQKVIDTRETLSVVEDVPDAQGELHTFESIKTPLILNNQVIGVLGISRNITQRKKLEEDIIKASRAKSNFLANMSHEIRTPINSIIGFSELAAEENLTAKAQTYLNYVTDSSQRLLHIINDILDVSKIEAGKLDFESIPVRLADIFEKLQTELSPKAFANGIYLMFNAEPLPKDTWILGDKFRLHQVFSNLITNAIKFTHQGGVKVNATLRGVSNGQATIHCQVSDTGIGMTPEQVERISEPFMQADESITRKYGGTGLGISIVKNLLEIMGSQLEIESIAGEGTKISFTITFKTTTQGGEENAPTIVNEKPIFIADVLVCEDNMMNQLVITDHLAKVGIAAVIAENGAIGVEKVQDRLKETGKSFDLIFMDMHMPVMSGLEATTKIFALGSNAPIIALTANVMAADKETYANHGIIDCMQKPFTAQELWTCLGTHLKESDVNTGAYVPEEDEALLQKLKKTFLRDNKNKFEEIMASIYVNDSELLHRQIHTLKGTAGLIGRGLLMNIASEIEEKLRANSIVPTDKWQLLESELNNTISALEIAFIKELEEAENPDAEIDLADIVARLEPLLQNRSPNSLDLVVALWAIPEAKDLAEQIENYEFKKALQTLENLRRSWGL